MNFEGSEEQVLLKDALRRFLGERYDFEQRRRIAAAPEGWSPERWADYAEFGWLALRVPEAYEGLGFSVVETLLLMTELGRAMVLEPVAASAIAGAQVLRAGREELARRLLPKVAVGAAIVAIAHAEPGQGRRAFGTATTIDAEGRLRGRKTLVPGAPMATHLVVTALRAGAPALIVIDAARSGVRLEPYRLIDGRAAADVVLEDVPIAEAELLAVGARAEAALEEALDWAAFAALAEALGGMEACLEITSEYLKTRVQFKQPIGRFQALQHLMADMFVDTQASRSILYAACSAIDDPARRRAAIARAQIVIGDASRRVAGSGLQMHGGYGLADEYRISHHYRQMQVLTRLHGDAQDAFDRMAQAPAAALERA